MLRISRKKNKSGRTWRKLEGFDEVWSFWLPARYQVGGLLGRGSIRKTTLILLARMDKNITLSAIREKASEADHD